jgi:hypothetical protein
MWNCGQFQPVRCKLESPSQLRLVWIEPPASVQVQELNSIKSRSEAEIEELASAGVKQLGSLQVDTGLSHSLLHSPHCSCFFLNQLLLPILLITIRGIIALVASPCLLFCSLSLFCILHAHFKEVTYHKFFATGIQLYSLSCSFTTDKTRNTRWIS